MVKNKTEEYYRKLKREEVDILRKEVRNELLKEIYKPLILKDKRNNYS